MSLLYKQDWEKTKENYNKWWAREDFGRCAVSVKARRNKPLGGKAPERPVKTEDKWLNTEYLKKNMDYHFNFIKTMSRNLQI